MAPTLDNFVPPLKGYPYFEGRAAFPFTTQADGFQLIDAGWLVDASLLAYEHGEGGVRAALEVARIDPKEIWADVAASGSTQCVAVQTPDFAILAFRGTRLESFPDPLDSLRSFFDSDDGGPPKGTAFVTPDWDDTLTYSNFLPDGDGVHRGFGEAIAALYQDDRFNTLLASLKDKPVWFTGHSLGAALATLAARRGGAGNPQGLYTFGSPRVGIAAFATALAEAFPRPCFRFVHGSDIVTALPPATPMASYRAVGELQYISERGELQQDATEAGIAIDRIEGSFAKAVGGVISGLERAVSHLPFTRPERSKIQIPFAALADHAPLYYANSIWQAIRDRGA